MSLFNKGAVLMACIFIKKDNPTQAFSCEYCKIRLLFCRVYRLMKSYHRKYSWYTLLVFSKMHVPLAFIFIILDFKDSLCFNLLQSNFHWRNFHKGAFLWANVRFCDFHGRQSSEAIFQGIFFRRKFHWTVQSKANSANLST